MASWRLVLPAVSSSAISSARPLRPRRPCRRRAAVDEAELTLLGAAPGRGAGAAGTIRTGCHFRASRRPAGRDCGPVNMDPPPSPPPGAPPARRVGERVRPQPVQRADRLGIYVAQTDGTRRRKLTSFSNSLEREFYHGLNNFQTITLVLARQPQDHLRRTARAARTSTSTS